MGSICLTMLICFVLMVFVFITMVVYEKECILKIKKELSDRLTKEIK